jgi:hypothetical protein
LTKRTVIVASIRPWLNTRSDVTVFGELGIPTYQSAREMATRMQFPFGPSNIADVDGGTW